MKKVKVAGKNPKKERFMKPVSKPKKSSKSKGGY